MLQLETTDEGEILKKLKSLSVDELLDVQDKIPDVSKSMFCGAVGLGIVGTSNFM